MHWIIQKEIFKPANYSLLTEALDRLQIAYSVVSIPNGTSDLKPEVNPAGKVYVCGAIKLKQIALQRTWRPGSFLNDNFSFDKWVPQLGKSLLNCDAVYGKFGEIQVDHISQFFIRPLEDNKAFDGMVLNAKMFDDWRRDPKNTIFADLDVLVSTVKKIYREYRLFVVKSKIVTGALYKVADKPHLSQHIEEGVIDFVNDVINTWAPFESVVIDVCLTDEGYKVIEFNNINSSGFYAINVQKYVEAIQMAYG